MTHIILMSYHFGYPDNIHSPCWNWKFIPRPAGKSVLSGQAVYYASQLQNLPWYLQD